MTRSTLCLNLTACALIRSKSSDSFRTSTRQSPGGGHATFQTEEGAAGSGGVDESPAEATVATAAAAAADGDDADDGADADDDDDDDDDDDGEADADADADEDPVGVAVAVAAESALPAITIGVKVGGSFFRRKCAFCKLHQTLITERGELGLDLGEDMI